MPVANSHPLTPFVNSHSSEGAGGLLNSLRDSVQVLEGSGHIRARWGAQGFRMKSGIGWGWGGSQGSSQSVQTVHRLLQAVSLAQVVIDLTVLHSGIRRLAPGGDFPHGHPKGPLWRAEGRELKCLSCTKTPRNTHS